MDKILVLDPHVKCLNTWSKFLQPSKYEAFVYKYPKATVTWLSNQCDKLNQTQDTYEWLWSHPEEGGDSTHVACLIQQDRAKLTTIRENIGYDG